MGLSTKIAGVIMALFLLGAIGGTAVAMASCSTSYAGASTGVITLFTVGVVSIAAVAIMLYFIPRRAMSFVPSLNVVVFAVKVRGWLRALLVKLRRI